MLTELADLKEFVQEGEPVSTPAMNDLHSHKVRKYDRQLRLWGDHGQAALEGAKLCLIGATSTGTEVLKNLVLPGVGSFCVVDEEKVTASDLGSNFFVTAQSLGQHRAEVVTRLLLEMNNDVKGDYVVDSLDSLLAHRASWLQSFSVIIVADNPSEGQLSSLSSLLWNAGIPLVICRAYGTIGYIRIVHKQHHVIESKPDNFVPDLRVESPFPQLQVLCDSFNLETMHKKQHSHLPYVILLVKFLQQWRAQHGTLPSTFKEKSKFREYIDEQRLKNEDGVPFPEENFEEACKAVMKTIAVPKVPGSLSTLFDDPSCVNLTKSSPKFWIVVRALKDFTETAGDGFLPLSGALPDMFSDTESFIKLQTVYKEKADSDAEVVFEKVQEFCYSLGLPKDHIKFSEVKHYCRNAAFLTCIQMTASLEAEYTGGSAVSSVLRGVSEDDAEFRSSMWYVMLRAVDRFYSETSRFPGSANSTLDEDAMMVKFHASKLLKICGAGVEFMALAADEVLENYAKEVTRSGAEQLHSVAAFIGGCVAQEVIKLVTGQYVPLNNTLIYDASSCYTRTVQI
ncbi:hypothetical protein RvY_10410 [Ramazzottius varieornatus]|uniref:NEDD8-activating enzyme E1 regulatory subunit n=1 Tax=Ramazzottius varieornatus TaxID=947166 RepID=A0A1D1VER7_RAMVA|nr:hypothetical protein RvY_10410 [Ramazzottius varieornatus]